MSEPFAGVPEVRTVDQLSGRVGAPEPEEDTAEAEQLRWTGAWW